MVLFGIGPKNILGSEKIAVTLKLLNTKESLLPGIGKWLFRVYATAAVSIFSGIYEGRYK